MMESGSPNYEIVIYWDKDDKLFVAEVPDLPGCVAHGQTRGDAAEKVGEAIELWLRTAREFGDPIPQPRVHHQLAA